MQTESFPMEQIAFLTESPGVAGISGFPELKYQAQGLESWRKGEQGSRFKKLCSPTECGIPTSTGC